MAFLIKLDNLEEDHWYDADQLIEEVCVKYFIRYVEEELPIAFEEKITGKKALHEFICLDTHNSSFYSEALGVYIHLTETIPEFHSRYKVVMDNIDMKIMEENDHIEEVSFSEYASMIKDQEGIKKKTKECVEWIFSNRDRLWI